MSPGLYAPLIPLKYRDSFPFWIVLETAKGEGHQRIDVKFQKRLCL